MKTTITTLVSAAVLTFTLTVSSYGMFPGDFFSVGVAEEPAVAEEGKFGVNITDDASYDNTHDQTNLFQLFNKYFENQLSEKFNSSNELFNKYGVDPTTDWTTSDSSIVGAFKVAAMEHNFSVTDKNGDILGEITNVPGSLNIVDNYGIKDLGSESIVLEDGHHIDFNLNAVAPKEEYTWASNGDNIDDKLHMIALEITELYNAKNGTDFDSVYMMCWEDLAGDRGYGADWDYQDFVSIITNVKPGAGATPEPATMLMFGIGLAGAAAFRRRVKK